MKTLYLFCGMPFSGKTTLAKYVANFLNSSYISLDELNAARGLYGGDGISVEEWEKTHSIAMKQLESLMQSEEDIVLDDTSCFRWLRDRYRDLGAQHYYQTILIFLDLPLSEILKRMEKNKTTKARRGVRQDIINKMAKTFELPQSDEITIRYSLDRPIEKWITEHFAKSEY